MTVLKQPGLKLKSAYSFEWLAVASQDDEQVQVFKKAAGTAITPKIAFGRLSIRAYTATSD